MDEPDTRRSAVIAVPEPGGDDPSDDRADRPTGPVTLTDLQRAVGELLLGADELTDSIAALARAEAAYEAGGHPSGTDPDITGRDRVTAGPDRVNDVRAIAVARVLARHTRILLSDADPDGAIGAAEAAIRLYLANADVINATPALTVAPPIAVPDTVGPVAAALDRAARVDEVIARDRTSGLRLALEAHLLFVGAARDVPGGGPDFLAQIGPPWLAMLDTCSRSCETAGQRDLAVDLARWMGAVAQHLGPLLAGEPAFRAQVEAALAWEATLLHARAG
jgi:hypothetical protein